MPRQGIFNVGGTRARVRPKEYTLNDFNLNTAAGDTKQLTADDSFEQLYVLDIEDGLGEWFGRGNNENPLQAQGFTGIRLVNDGAAALAEGEYRISVRNTRGRLLYTLHESELANDDLYDGAAGGGTKKDRRDRTVFTNRQSNFETEPHEISIDVNVSSDIEVDDAEAETSGSFEGYRAESLE